MIQSATDSPELHVLLPSPEEEGYVFPWNGHNASILLGNCIDK